MRGVPGLLVARTSLACWHGADLAPSPHTECRCVWLLDWEMARRGEALRDAEQLLDNLWVMQQVRGKAGGIRGDGVGGDTEMEVVGCRGRAG